MSRVILGTDMDTGEVVRLGDIERRHGLYLLGRTGMGKSALAVNIALKDIDHGHGVFFIDPAGDVGRLKQPYGLAHFLGLHFGIPTPVIMGFMRRNDRGQKPGKKFGPKTAFLDTPRVTLSMNSFAGEIRRN